MDFSSLDAHPALARALAEHGYEHPTPVQAAVLESPVRGRDLLVSSRTGSGKTVAFGLVLAETLLGAQERFEPSRAPGALVVAPTRELALQVHRELSWLFAGTGARIAACVGGMDPRRESRTLAEGTHVVVGTPGRLRDHLDRRNLSLAKLRVLVLDEADEMLDMGFREELEALLGAAPAERRTILFSATLPRPIIELARRYTREAVRVTGTPPEEAHADIVYRAHLIAPRERVHALVNVLRAEEAESALVFFSTREGVNHGAAALVERGFQAVPLSGELTQQERNRALKALRDGRARVLVATDVAARGLDLPTVGLVVHAEPPRDAQALQHRSGRTGRAGRKGLAVLLAAPPERFRMERMLRDAGVAPVWAPVPPPDSVRQRDRERLAAELARVAAEASEEELAAARALAEDQDPLRLLAALLRRELARYPAAEELPETARAAREVPASRARREARPAAGVKRGVEGVWFRVSIGREQKADPKWILPLVCRRGEVTRESVGRIQVLPRETRFEIAAEVAPAFEKAARTPDPRMPNARIGRVNGPAT